MLTEATSKYVNEHNMVEKMEKRKRAVAQTNCKP